MAEVFFVRSAAEPYLYLCATETRGKYIVGDSLLGAAGWKSREAAELFAAQLCTDDRRFEVVSETTGKLRKASQKNSKSTTEFLKDNADRIQRENRSKEELRAALRAKIGARKDARR